jgi:hypothetical protein
MMKRPCNFYKRVRMFCDLRVRHVSLATGISEFAITQIEKNRREPNQVEARLIESYLRDRLRIVFEMDGSLPDWTGEPSPSKEGCTPRLLGNKP